MAFSLAEKPPEYVLRQTDEDEKLKKCRKNATEHIELLKHLYNEQMQGVKNGIYNTRKEMMGDFIFFMFIFLLECAIQAIFGPAIGTIIGVAIVYWVFISTRNFILSLRKYCVLCEKGPGKIYARKNDVFTYHEEAKFCKKKLTELNEMLVELDNLEKKHIEKYCEELMKLEYIEKRALL